MKNLLVIALMTCALFGACKRNKITKVSAKDTSNSTDKTSITKPKPNISDTLKSHDLPPQSVSDVFKVNYPAVNNVVWDLVNVPLKQGYVYNYKAYFIVNNRKHWVVYDQDGKWVESREQILPDQLPQNIFIAIKNRYPSGHIELATTYKNSTSPGTYAVLVKPQINAPEIEVILLENGSFVK